MDTRELIHECAYHSPHLNNQCTGSTYYEEDGASELKSSSVSCPLLRSCVLKRAPPGAYVTVTSSEGDRVYLRLKSEIKTEKTLGGMLSSTCGLQLLTIPFSDLKDDMEEEVHEHGGARVFSDPQHFSQLYNIVL